MDSHAATQITTGDISRPSYFCLLSLYKPLKYNLTKQCQAEGLYLASYRNFSRIWD